MGFLTGRNDRKGEERSKISLERFFATVAPVSKKRNWTTSNTYDRGGGTAWEEVEEMPRWRE